MKITRQDFEWAADRGVLQSDQVDALWLALEERRAQQPRFDLANVSYYAGALIVIGAMGWFMTLAWEDLPGVALSGIALAYALTFVLLSRWLWDRLQLRVPGGLLLTAAVCMAPLATYGILKQFDLWPQGDPGAYRGFHVWVKGSWIAMELSTVLAGIVALRYRRFPFLTAPIAVALWYLSMDLAPLLYGVPHASWDEREWVSVWFGLVMLVIAYAIDLRGRDEGSAIWVYLFGVLAFWGGLSVMDSDTELGKFLYFLINLGLIAVALVLRRTIFMIFGALGVMGYVGHLAYRIFANSMLFSVALTIVGLSVIALGVIYQRNRHTVQQALHQRLPLAIRALVPSRARG